MNKLVRLGMAGLLAITMLSIAQAQERKLKRAQLPPAVAKTVAEQSQGATIVGFTSEVEKGQRLYEAELKINGLTKDILMDKNGNIVEVEAEVTMDSLPSAVQEGLKRVAGNRTIVKVESLTKNGTLVAYEAVVKAGAKRSEIQVGPNGEKLGKRQ